MTKRDEIRLFFLFLVRNSYTKVQIENKDYDENSDN